MKNKGQYNGKMSKKNFNRQMKCAAPIWRGGIYNTRLTKLRRKKVSSRKNAINIKKVPRMKQTSEIRRIPAPTPETVDLKKTQFKVMAIKIFFKYWLNF